MMSSEELDNYPLKVCVVIDNDASARSAVRMVQRVSKTTHLRLTLLHLHQLVSALSPDGLGSTVLDSELFIVAMSHEGELPDSTKTWIERWACLRREANDCALVAFVTSGSLPLDSRSPLVEYLGAIAAARGLAFFYGKSQGLVRSDPPQRHEHDAHCNAMHRIVVSRNGPSPKWGINE
jgi:hypothetical protein